MKKHQRNVVRAIRDLGFEVLGFVPGTTGHLKLQVRLSDGTVKTLPTASTPKCSEISVKLALMNLRAAERGMIPGGRNCEKRKDLK